MEMIADGLLIAGALTAAFYCWVLSSRVKGLADLDNGLGSAIAALSTQVDEMQSALKAARSVNDTTAIELDEATTRAAEVSKKLSLLIASSEEMIKSSEPKAKKSPSARIEKFPTKQRAKPSIEQIIRDEENSEREEGVPPSKAKVVQKNVSERMANRTESDEREELVKTLQDILAANE